MQIRRHKLRLEPFDQGRALQIIDHSIIDMNLLTHLVTLYFKHKTLFTVLLGICCM